MRAFLSLALFPFLLVGSALAREPAQEISAALLVYRVQEQGAEPYISRILVTPGYLRMDEGADDDGFILYDRAAHVIYSITPSEQSLLVIDPPKDKPESPLLLAVSEERHDDPQAPAVAGIHPLRYGLKVNGHLCDNLVVLPGVMPGALAALGEYFETLSYQQAVTVEATPPEMQDACDLSRYVYHPTREVSFGLPVHIWNDRQSRELVDFRESFSVAPQLFELPEGYERLTVPGSE